MCFLFSAAERVLSLLSSETGYRLEFTKSDTEIVTSIVRREPVTMTKSYTYVEHIDFNLMRFVWLMEMPFATMNATNLCVPLHCS